MRAITAIALLCLPCAGFAQAGDATADRLLSDYDSYNEACRGGSGDSDLTWQACGARDYIGYLLGDQFGLCLGQEDQAGYEMEWHACGDGSLRIERPDFNE